jgi:hypothetical protein
MLPEAAEHKRHLCVMQSTPDCRSLDMQHRSHQQRPETASDRMVTVRELEEEEGLEHRRRLNDTRAAA